MNYKKIAPVLLAVLFGLLSSCQKDDSAKQYGFSMIYMPQSNNVSSAGYIVPGYSNNGSPTSANYILDTVNQKVNIILGASLSGTATRAYTVDIGVNNDTIQQLISNGTFGSNYLLMPASVYTLPSQLTVPATGSNTFYLSLDIKQLIQNRAAFLGKHLALAVKLSNPSVYQLNPALSTTIIDFTFSDGLIGFPVTTGASEYNFVGGEHYTIYGSNLKDVSKVVYTGTTTPLTINFTTPDSIGITLPTPDANFIQNSVDITTPVTTATTSFEFVNVNNAVVIFADDYAPGYVDANHWLVFNKTTSVAKRGTASLAALYPSQGYAVGGIKNVISQNGGFIFDPSYQYISFWVKGGTQDNTIYLSSGADWDNVGGGLQIPLSNSTSPSQSLAIAVPANKWLYCKIPISTARLWASSPSTPFSILGWSITGPSGADQTLYYDDVIFIK
jgi:hypothetical protein